jgi:Mrp family chromosome partitioning ATPase
MEGLSMNIQKEKTNELTNIKNVIAIMSGKGGVGKSSVTSLIAVSLKNKGYKVGILDADITGPSIPKVFGINKKRASSIEDGIIPVKTATGIEVMSINLLIEQEDSPVVWRGPLVANTVKQFYTDVIWGDLDYLLIDLPPGTGDVPLTIMQSVNLTNFATLFLGTTTSHSSISVVEAFIASRKAPLADHIDSCLS